MSERQPRALVACEFSGRVRALFDLTARPDVIAKHLKKDALLASAVRSNPGIRVPGAFDGFEMGVRAILGQQVTVKAATTIASRFVEAFGEPIVTPFAELNRLTPRPARIAAATVDDIARQTTTDYNLTFPTPAELGDFLTGLESRARLVYRHQGPADGPPSRSVGITGHQRSAGECSCEIEVGDSHEPAPAHTEAVRRAERDRRQRRRQDGRRHGA